MNLRYQNNRIHYPTLGFVTDPGYGENDFILCFFSNFEGVILKVERIFFITERGKTSYEYSRRTSS